MVGHNWAGVLQPSDATKPAQPGGCVQCHPGLGAKPNPVEKLSQADEENVDCLLCHAPGYRRTVVKQGDKFEIRPAEGVDVLAAARAVRRPTDDMCQRCHLGAGGGPNAKHGVAPTSPAVDVHLAKGIGCVDCHPTKNHRTAGGADIKANEAPEVAVACSGCHAPDVHRGADAATLTRHAARLACQTCHIPAIARDPKFPTVVRRDWTKPVLNEKTGLYGPANQLASGVRPEYRWWNRKMTVPPEPLGDRADPAAKIYPWKRATYTVVGDARTGKPVFIKAGLYAVKGDPLAAARKGAEDTKQEFSGAVKGVEESMLFSLNHQVAPKAQALACDACHRAGGALDFEALGYPPERVKALTAPRR
ncbi:hypothetical protein [Anaeromyxobacter diazotrophicus]|uniref:Cytochrome c n=1 Tax=Anaeromyxobacter diazotrophicus TaxID=2590199 RepID=A0A7I9VHJ8_9BACT|nr:hypothetical protein [Anaeromyxobacter diazotrophicus]GEJ55719.1 cytochrome c [Anaeromyxobacter diazotrophicus]